MDGKYYTSERSLQILISLLKQHKIKKCVLSPGATNLTFVASLQQDPWFECFSSVDERSAAYIACGLAAESGEPEQNFVIICILVRLSVRKLTNLLPRLVTMETSRIN